MKSLLFLMCLLMLSISALSAAVEKDPCEKPITNSRLLAMCQCELPIETQSELKKQCGLASKAYFESKGKRAYNWSANYWGSGNRFFVKGEWSVDNQIMQVQCETSKGAKVKNLSMKLGNKYKGSASAKSDPRCR
ncbi:hypothetical protein [Shewanella woodyi]|uniref:hypothetical protein n=1 Tax=Shewanella woodyi TaxID=60961 RepID=UPI0007F86FDB|nr:hypothetical protein [Shewanella woodyi]